MDLDMPGFDFGAEASSWYICLASSAVISPSATAFSSFASRANLLRWRVYKRGVGNIWGHVLKFINWLHILANVTGSYGV